MKFQVLCLIQGQGGKPDMAPLWKIHCRITFGHLVLSKLTFLDPKSVNQDLPSDARCGRHSSVLLADEAKFSRRSGPQAAGDSTSERGSRCLPTTQPRQLPGQLPANTTSPAPHPGGMGASW